MLEKLLNKLNLNNERLIMHVFIVQKYKKLSSSSCWKLSKLSILILLLIWALCTQMVQTEPLSAETCNIMGCTWSNGFVYGLIWENSFGGRGGAYFFFVNNDIHFLISYLGLRVAIYNCKTHFLQLNPLQIFTESLSLIASLVPFFY